MFYRTDESHGLSQDPFNAIVVGRFDESDPVGTVEWGIGAYVDIDTTGSDPAGIAGKPVYDDELMALKEDAEAQESRSEDVDEKFDQAVAIVLETRNASISYIQRRLKIGYNRAARIIEQMENDGMVGPQEGTRPRSVYLREPDEEDAY